MISTARRAVSLTAVHQYVIIQTSLISSHLIHSTTHSLLLNTNTVLKISHIHDPSPIIFFHPHPVLIYRRIRTREAAGCSPRSRAKASFWGKR